MPRLNDSQALLLAHAGARDSGSLYPLPEGHKRSGARGVRAIEALVTAALLEERETTLANEVAREDGDLRFGLYATDAGLAAVGIETECVTDYAGSVVGAPAAPAPRQTKSAQVVALLGRDDGASLADLVAATGWLPHTTRAALTGLRKKGHAVERFRAGDVSRYRITGAR